MRSPYPLSVISILSENRGGFTLKHMKLKFQVWTLYAPGVLCVAECSALEEELKLLSRNMSM